VFLACKPAPTKLYSLNEREEGKEVSEESPEVEEKEEFGCWICDERMGFKKLVTHLRAHSDTEKLLAYTTQTTKERKERDNGKARPDDTHLPQGKPDLSGGDRPTKRSKSAQSVVPGKVEVGPAERGDAGLLAVPEGEPAPEVVMPKAAKRASASIASL
jgi:hypothetical protein